MLLVNYFISSVNTSKAQSAGGKPVHVHQIIECKSLQGWRDFEWTVSR